MFPGGKEVSVCVRLDLHRRGTFSTSIGGLSFLFSLGTSHLELITGTMFVLSNQGKVLIF